MKQIKWSFLLLALLATSCIVGVGISVGLRSIVGVIICSLATVFCFGAGFSLKKKLL